jgi:hypothetical protein
VKSQGKTLAKLLIEDKEEATSVPFLRGILTRSLQQAGLSFQQAYAVADEVREELGDERTLSKLELHRIVYKNQKTSLARARRTATCDLPALCRQCRWPIWRDASSPFPESCTVATWSL